MFIRIMEVIQEQEDALLGKIDAREGKTSEKARTARLDVVAAFNAIKSQVRCAERDLIDKTIAAKADLSVIRQGVEALVSGAKP
jgi:hypothetical protein